MRKTLFEQVRFICPRCRHATREGIAQYPLKLDQVLEQEGDYILEGFLSCTNPECDSKYPVLQGVPIVLKDLKRWWHYEKSQLTHINCHSVEVRNFFKNLIIDDPLIYSERSLLSTYMELHYGSYDRIPDILKSFADPEHFWNMAINMARLASKTKYELSIDLGCSVGRYTYELAGFSNLAVGIDLNFNEVLMAAEFQRTQKMSYDRKKYGKYFEKVQIPYIPMQNVLFLVSDTLDPPFGAESFDLVSGLNVVDNVKLPLVLIGQMDAMLRQGGSLILGSPYEWRTDICEPEEWLESENMDAPVMVRHILEGKIFSKMGLHYEILEELHDVPWTLRHHDRHWSAFLVHLIMARKTQSINGHDDVV
ncbi:MAG: methyltransferase domain-containing protein [Candidatus Hodarchaeota archaeon]